MKPSQLACCLLALCTHLGAAVVNVGPAAIGTTYYDPSPPWNSSIETSSSITVDLSDLSGLTTGADIQITFSTAVPIFWTGAWRANSGMVTLIYDATLTLSVGSHAISSSPPWQPFGPVDFDETFNPVVGYEIGPVPDSFALTVPWGTNLSNVILTLTDRFSMTGPGVGIDGSQLTLDSLSLSTASVPEPTAATLTILSTAALCRRRRSPKEGWNPSARCS